ncbi:TadE/TadG family type IV pilus assembly protein [uncultured Nocardioides sp.]|jgi:Flp pilus assembly protein TadG|uniref:TadE/TadG family type IV pilus assembly protein n=1 Tax=uncultured Nocardioides sp. TaxID=198441 RepID=UPI000C5967B8|nr:TadE/TadG family type IV pilus assembly protein [uncultured Nocardioides sp.]MAO80878.1 pilus assembly protein TadE [Nocardioides sp.]
MGFRRRERGERGAAAVEFALVVPLLLMLVFGIIQYGYILSFRQALSQGAAEGARAAAVAPSSLTTAQKQTAATNAVQQALGSYGVTCGTAVMTCAVTLIPCPQATGKTCAQVALTYDYDARPLMPKVPLVPVPGSLTYTAVAEVS